MKHSEGFTLVELMIVIAIIGVLASIAVPQYGNYTKRARFAYVIGLTMDRKTAVSLCFQENNTFRWCSGTGSESDDPAIPIDIDAPGKGVLKSIVTRQGVITATGTIDVDHKTYILTPARVDYEIVWEYDGTCIEAQLCR